MVVTGPISTGAAARAIPWVACRSLGGGEKEWNKKMIMQSSRVMDFTPARKVLSRGVELREIHLES